MKQNPLLRCSRAIRICAAPFAALFAVSASAANVSWNGAADAVWSTGGNWVGGVAPVAADVAVFDAGSSANLTTALGAVFFDCGFEDHDARRTDYDWCGEFADAGCRRD